MRALGLLVLALLAGCRDRSPPPAAGPPATDHPGSASAPGDRLDAVLDPRRPIPGGDLVDVRPDAARDLLAGQLPCAGQGASAARCRLGGVEVTVAFIGRDGSQQVDSITIAPPDRRDLEGALTRRWGPGLPTLDRPGVEAITWRDAPTRIRATYYRHDVVDGPRLVFGSYREVEEYLAVRADGSSVLLPRIGERFADDPAAPHLVHLREYDQWGAVLVYPPTPRAPSATVVRVWLDPQGRVTDSLIELDAEETDAVRRHFEGLLGAPIPGPDPDTLVFRVEPASLVVRLTGHHVAIYHGPDPPRWPQ